MQFRVDEELKLDWDQDGVAKNEQDDEEEAGIVVNLNFPVDQSERASVESVERGNEAKLDIMAQQLKFIACLKVILLSNHLMLLTMIIYS